MPPVVVILTESEATHVKELVQQDRDGSVAAARFFPEAKFIHDVMAELDEGILKKFADLDV